MAFTGNDPKDTYLGILTLGDDGGGPPIANTLHPTTLQAVLDAAYNASLLELSQDKVAFTGIMEASVSGITLDAAVPLEADDLITNQVLDKSDNNVGVFFVTGDPEGAVTGGIGSLVLRKDGSTGTSLYVKESGIGDTGWIPVDVVTTFLGLTDTPMVYSAEKWVRVNAGGTGLEFVDPPTVGLGNFNELADVPPLYGGFGGFVVAVNLAETGLTFTNAAVGAFTDLSDTPAALVANKFLQVNPTGTAIVLVDVTESNTAFIELTDAPSDYVDMQGALVAVNSVAGALEFTGDGAEQGELLFFNGTNWVALGVGTDGYVLKTHGINSDPTWAEVGAKYYDTVQEPVTNGNPVTPEILFDATGDVIVVSTTTEYTTH